jgi:hypothetical protein
MGASEITPVPQGLPGMSPLTGCVGRPKITPGIAATLNALDRP